MKTTLTVEQLKSQIIQLCRSGEHSKAIGTLRLLGKRGVWEYQSLYVVVDYALQINDEVSVRPLIAQLVKKRAGDWQAWELRYKLYRSAARWEAALSAVQKAEQMASTKMPWVYLAKAECLERLLLPSKALDALLEIEKLGTEAQSSKYWYLKATALLQLDELDQLVGDIMPAIEKLPADHYAASALKVVGKALDRLARYDEAFGAFHQANSILGDGFSISDNGLRKRIEVYRALYTHEWVSQWKESRTDRQPVFLIGFPRSGTTLLEQIIDAHPKVQALEEPPTLSNVMRELVPWLNASAISAGEMSASQSWKSQWLAGFSYLAQLSDDQIKKLRKIYFDSVSARADFDSEKLLIDKMPLNSVEVGLILRLFPKAKFIVAVRHPCDSILSGYMQAFEMNEAMANFVDLEAAASFYRNVMSLLAQYEEVFGLTERMHTIRYEDVVADMEGQARALLAFLGLDWHENVLSFDKHARQRKTLATPSYHGVTQKIYTGSVERWRNYERWIAPVLPQLKESAARYGYDLSSFLVDK